MVWEALTNTVKHPRTSRVDVTFRFDERSKRHCLTINDSSCGFDIKNSHQGEEPRSVQMHADEGRVSVRIESHEHGTSVIVLLPVVE
jgi:signal transduction histidine kinase